MCGIATGSNRKNCNCTIIRKRTLNDIAQSQYQTGTVLETIGMSALPDDSFQPQVNVTEHVHTIKNSWVAHYTSIKSKVKRQTLVGMVIQKIMQSYKGVGITLDKVHPTLFTIS